MRPAMLALILTILAACGADAPPEPPEERDSPVSADGEVYFGISGAP